MIVKNSTRVLYLIGSLYEAELQCAASLPTSQGDA